MLPEIAGGGAGEGAEDAGEVVVIADADLLRHGGVDDAQLAPYEQAGCSVIAVGTAPDGRLRLDALIAELGARGLDSVIVEGGPTLLGALFDAHLIDRVQAYIAPKLFGGAAAPGPIGGCGVALPSQAARLADVRTERLGCDILIEGDIVRGEGAAEEGLCSPV